MVQLTGTFVVNLSVYSIVSVCVHILVKIATTETKVNGHMRKFQTCWTFAHGQTSSQTKLEERCDEHSLPFVKC